MADKPEKDTGKIFAEGTKVDVAIKTVWEHFISHFTKTEDGFDF